MIDQRNMPEGQVPCITVLGPSEPKPKHRVDFGFYPGGTDDYIRFRASAFYGFTVRDPHQPIFSTGSTS